MSETNKANTVAFHKKAVFEGDVENAFRMYAGAVYRQHNPLIEDGMEGLGKFVARIMASHPDAHGEIKRVFADGDYVILHSHWHGLSDDPRGEAVVDIYRSENDELVEHWVSSSRSRRRLRTTTRCSDLLTTTRGGDTRVQPAGASILIGSMFPYDHGLISSEILVAFTNSQRGRCFWLRTARAIGSPPN